MVAVLVHLLAVWAAPDIIMRVAGNKIGAGIGGVLHAPPITAQSRTIVLPSPDMLYSVCLFDLSTGPMHITANPKLSSYWSIALYAANSDNFFVLNDQQARGKPVDLQLVSSQSAAAASPGAVVAPTDSGLLLMRVLTGDYEAEKAVLEPARRSLQCTPFKPA
jgi:uncharacterized membrane protein